MANHTNKTDPPSFIRSRGGIVRPDNMLNVATAIENLDLRFVSDDTASAMIEARFNFRPTPRIWAFYLNYQQGMAEYELGLLRGEPRWIPSSWNK